MRNAIKLPCGCRRDADTELPLAWCEEHYQKKFPPAQPDRRPPLTENPLHMVRKGLHLLSMAALELGLSASSSEPTAADVALRDVSQVFKAALAERGDDWGQ